MNLSLYLLTVLIWGTTWIAIKLQMGPVAITLSIAYRFALAALVLFAVLLLGRRLQRLDARGQRLCMAQGVCLFCLNFICFYTASQWIPSGLVAVVFSTATLWNALNARLWFGQRIASNVMAGGGLGLLGLGLLFWPELVGHQATPETFYGLGLALLPRHAAHQELANGLLRELPVEELPLYRSWCLVHAKGKRLSPVAQAFVAFVREERALISQLAGRFAGPGGSS